MMSYNRISVLCRLFTEENTIFANTISVSLSHISSVIVYSAVTNHSSLPIGYWPHPFY